MSFSRASLLISAALVLGSAQGASAADLGSYGGGSIKDAPMAMPMQSSGPSWYLRADGAYGTFDDPSITEDRIYDFVETSIDDTWSFGGGVGRYFGQGFRGDVTVERIFEADVSGRLADHKADLEGTRTFGMKSTVVLANMYYDFNEGGRFSPYIGVGLGWTRNETGAGSVVDDCGCFTGTIDGAKTTHVAGAAMAGVTWNLRERLALDMGYRFMYLGEAETGPVTAVHDAASGGATVISDDPIVDEIHAHQFRFGLRYNIQ